VDDGSLERCREIICYESCYQFPRICRSLEPDDREHTRKLMRSFLDSVRGLSAVKL
jgi:hypothetical protein